MSTAQAILPGVYITVRDEGLISVGGVTTGNIGIVGTALRGTSNKVEILSSFADAQDIFGPSKDSKTPAAVADDQSYTLLKALEHVFGNGGNTVLAVKAESDSAPAYQAALEPNKL